MAMKDGGPAFPRVGGVASHGPQVGMSLRDWFAGQALAGAALEMGLGYTVEASAAHFAELSYALADAMLAAREK